MTESESVALPFGDSPMFLHYFPIIPEYANLYNTKIMRRNNSQTLYLNQDMREIDLHGSVQGFICIFDSLNYLLDEAGLSFVHAVDDVTDGPPGSLSGRVAVVAKRA